MKKIFSLVAVAVMTAMTFTSCCDGEDTSVDVVNFEGSKWTALIDNPQYGGKLLYGTGMGFTTESEAYKWTDDVTSLTSTIENAYGAWCYWNGGIAMSNYVDANITDHATSAYQLAVPQSNGSSTWGVVYCSNKASMSLKTAKVIRSIQVGPTTYELGVAKKGDNYSKALTAKGDYLTLVITGYNGSAVTGVQKVDMARDGQFLENWTNVSLASFGAVTKVEFSMEGSDKSYGYLNTPAYFALDNIVIQK